MTERPVPTADEPMSEVERVARALAVSTVHSIDAAREYAKLAGMLAQPSPHQPTREQIRSAVDSVLFNASNYPRPAAPHILGQDIGPLCNKVTDAVLALIQNETGT